MSGEKQFESINQTFNIDSEIEVVGEVVKSEESIVSEPNSKTKPDIKSDYEYTRANLYSLIEKGQSAIDGILELAQEGEQARAYEVAGQLIKNVGDVTDKLLDLQKKLKEVESESTSKGPTNVTNALFVGSTADLSKLIKNNLKLDK